MLNKLNISIDDVSPHPKSSIKVLDRCFELIDVFPNIKFTLFVPMAYTRLNEKSYYVSEYPDFCEILKNLPTNNFELGWHGYFHGIIGKSNNDEFKSVSYDEAIVIFNKMYAEADKSNIRGFFKPILRPSAFRMSPTSILASKDNQIKILALSLKPNIKSEYYGEDINHGRVVYYNINPPFDSLKLYNNMEIVYHACEWDKSHFNKEKSCDLKMFVEKNIGDIDFVFMEGM
jgi:predicted deacetylase